MFHGSVDMTEDVERGLNPFYCFQQLLASVMGAIKSADIQNPIGRAVGNEDVCLCRNLGVSLISVGSGAQSKRTTI
jgi:hypothetical protein